MKIIKRLTIQNELGLHMRPAAYILKLLHRSKSSVYFTHKNETVNARSIINILMMVAKKNEEIEVSIEGEDAVEVMNLLAEAFANAFGEKDGAS